MRLRLMGTREEINAVTAVLPEVLDVQEVSGFYPHRGTSTLGRVYVDIAGVRTPTLRVHADRADQESTEIEPGPPRRRRGELR